MFKSLHAKHCHMIASLSMISLSIEHATARDVCYTCNSRYTTVDRIVCTLHEQQIYL